ncbi:hypothetical protein [Azospirillum canadense]|uniref:hypothetical protein n=1 Tax=Azospirillum canadense TaxID=403962 RepID=UPI002226FC50|nr:hypothetical protein [Azospirillum canadense]MCW2241815.1 hypothetical protein [Azospirillum canadense]
MPRTHPWNFARVGHASDIELFAHLPEHLRPHAIRIYFYIVENFGEFNIDNSDLAEAIASPMFRELLEQEAAMQSGKLIT